MKNVQTFPQRNSQRKGERNRDCPLKKSGEEKDGKGEDYQARCQGNLRRKCNEAPQAA